MAIASDKTELELFFSPRIAGNSPQFATSPAFFELVVSLASLIDGLAYASSSNVGVGSQEALMASWSRDLLHRAVMAESKLRVDQSRDSVFALVELLSDIISAAKRVGTVTPSPSSDLLFRAKKVLVSLLLVAKDSEDSSLKNQVLILAKRWEAGE